MVQLMESDIRTREVLGWKGLHLFHAQMSSCSQKVRIFLNLKGIRWEGHLVDLHANENLTPWYLGINPRGVVPVLVDDGAVHIESNDILVHLDRKFPEPRLIPAGAEHEVAALLKHEDDLHLDLRTLSFRFIFAPEKPPKSEEDLRKYRTHGTGKVQGQDDHGVAEQIEFWGRVAREGLTDAAARMSALRFRDAFAELEARLQKLPYLLGDQLTVVDIAWFIYANRVALAGYPLARLHPRVGAWFERLGQRPEFVKEIGLPPLLAERFAAQRRKDAAAGKSLELVAGF